MKQSPTLPLPLLVLDILGCLLIGLGMAMHFTQAEILPGHLRFANDGIIYIVIGAGVMLPAIIHLLNRARKR